ncbi:DUF475 domain-containing protein [Streptomyces sp. BPPL-273]|uniref:Uncharacterized protein n=2 Tax=Streptomyces parvulus TaxID=146923 RepID=A0A191V7W3_9ACTN|nr:MULTISPECIES: DUF475 domain-containing protein [Streptomyces]ANJ10983.1 hypothetical protein Spa2297_30765 [Streptomyces parvulus]MCQ4194332.1 DUF475 domain-containing protein [Streptomyces parvulus]WHM28957.1 DUF475 domain-containing protein [Streptomyces sp. BPPL-273]WML84162.1 DUF475 domain-containing protein [Streptomyces sp. VNUA74]GGR67246.1 hypothetical protein GCM10010220_18860 [Streptomyces parvulus]
MLLKTFRWAFAVTALGLAVGVLYDGWAALGIVAILSVLEVSLSFDNAVINAGILKKMNAFWQKIFLTVGIVIAVFGMRLVFPVVIVAISARLSPWNAVHLALTDKQRYQELVTDAHPSIAAFGGMFLMMIFLDFILEDREIKWLGRLERPLAKLGRVDMLSVCVALVVLLVSAITFGAHAHQHGGVHADKTETVLLAGVGGLITYMVVGGLSGFFEQRLEDEEEREREAEQRAERGKGPGSPVKLAGKAAFFMFLYLEVLDASFSFDGVIGAFAITNDIVLMALGLGIGAMYVRSLTVYLVRQGTLDDYVYLEHGAHYAIGALSVILLVTIQHEINEIVTGLIGVVLIGASFWSSVRRNRALRTAS